MTLSNEVVTKKELTVSEMMSEISMLGIKLSSLQLVAPDLAPIAIYYFGGLAHESSLGNKARTKAETGQDFAKMFNETHLLFRFEIPKYLAMEIDPNCFSKETQKTLHDLDEKLNFYRKVASARKKAGLADDIRIKDDPLLQYHQDDFIRELHKLQGEIKESELGLGVCNLVDDTGLKIQKGVTLLVGPEKSKVTISVGSKFGFYVWALPHAAISLSDNNKISEPTKLFIKNITGAGAAIIAKMVGYIKDEEALHPLYKAMFEEVQPKIIAALKNGERALQMRNLYRETTLVESSCTYLLKKIEANPYPSELINPLECGLVLDAIQRGVFLKEDQELLVSNCIKDLAEGKVTARLAIIKPIINSLVKAYPEDELLKVKVTLVNDFLERLREQPMARWQREEKGNSNSFGR